jgi:uncharacterized Tic20 family protein
MERRECGLAVVTRRLFDPTPVTRKEPSMSDIPESPLPPNPAPPQPPQGSFETGLPSGEERQFALFVHLSSLIGFFIPFANIIAPLILWQIKKAESAFIDDQGKEAVNFNITLAIIGLGLMLFTFITFGLGALLTVPAGLALALAWLVLAIMAGIKANEGVTYRYPYIFRLIK